MLASHDLDVDVTAVVGCQVVLDPRDATGLKGGREGVLVDDDAHVDVGVRALVAAGDRARDDDRAPGGPGGGGIRDLGDGVFVVLHVAA